MQGASDASAGCGHGGTPAVTHNYKRQCRKSLQTNEISKWQNNANPAAAIVVPARKKSMTA